MKDDNFEVQELVETLCRGTRCGQCIFSSTKISTCSAIKHGSADAFNQARKDSEKTQWIENVLSERGVYDLYKHLFR